MVSDIAHVAAAGYREQARRLRLAARAKWAEVKRADALGRRRTAATLAISAEAIEQMADVAEQAASAEIDDFPPEGIGQ